jgi:S1-C subfamily serine protease
MTRPDGNFICTGTLIKKDGLVLTAKHCVENATAVYVIFAGASIRATVLATSSWQDLALVDIPGNLYPAMSMCSSISIEDNVCGVGRPEGILEYECGVTTAVGPMLILSDTALRKGFSGGPLIHNEQNCLAGVSYAAVDFIRIRRTLHVGLDEVKRFIQHFMD